MTWKEKLQKARRTLWGSRFRRVGSILALVIGFAAAVATLYPLIESRFFPRHFTVYVLHHSVGESEGGVWSDFDRGLDRFLVANSGKLNGEAVRIRSDYSIAFHRGTWRSGDVDQLRARLESVLADNRTLAIVAATSSEESEVIRDRLAEEDDPPLLLLALATRNDLLRRETGNGDSDPLAGVFRMVPRNESQAHRLAMAILNSDRAACGTADPPLDVLILREEGDNATFSRDLAAALQRELASSQTVRVLVDATVDGMLAVPREIVDLQADFLVYIGSQSGAARVYAQMEHLAQRAEGACPPPRLILTDAGLLGEVDHYFQGVVADSVAALPLSGRSGERADFGLLGADSGKLVWEAADEALDSPRPRLNRRTFAAAMTGLDLGGEAHDYRFEQGENARADFHQWTVRNGVWQHDPQCSSTRCGAALRAERPPPGRAVLASRDEQPALRVGSKTFAEGRLLAALAVEMLDDAGIPARLGEVSLNGLRGLLLLDRVDLYWEYTGTALSRYHGRSGLRGLDALDELRSLDAPHAVWLNPLPVDNVYRLLARRELVTEHGLDTISKMARHVAANGRITLCSNDEWFPSPDGLAGLEETYGFEWPSDLRVGRPVPLLYTETDGCDVLVGYATDPQIDTEGRIALDDDGGFFSEYLPTPVFREDVYRELERRVPKGLQTFEDRLGCLGQRMDVEAMRRLLQRMAVDGESAEDVAAAFLRSTCPATAGEPTPRDGSGQRI